ncbi:Uncharacterised protein [uncultured archaeon]|nr:Uncharacterised protein [uncultured archaeon]
MCFIVVLAVVNCMASVVDKRNYAEEVRETNRFLGGGLVSSADLMTLAVDRRVMKEIVSAAKVVHMNEFGEGDGPLDSVYDRFNLVYEGPQRKLWYLGREGARTEFTLYTGETMAHLSCRMSNFFPNDLLAGLLEMKAGGGSQADVFGAFRGYYSERGRVAPKYEDAKLSLVTVKVGDGDPNNVRVDPKFPDGNVFLIFSEAEPYLRGMQVTGLLLDSAVAHFKGVGYSPKYAVGYARMARFSEVSGQTSTATADEAMEYLERYGDSDWSVRFHRNIGGNVLCALPGFAVDPQSRNAGVLVVYDLGERLKALP